MTAEQYDTLPANEPESSGEGRSTRRDLRVIGGFAIAPAVPPALVYLIGVALRDPHPIWGTIVIAVFSYGAAIGFGMPCYLIFRARGISKLTSYVVAGATIGAAFGTLEPLTTLVSHLAMGWAAVVVGAPIILENLVRQVAFGAISGALSSVVFWAFVPMRSDSNAPPDAM